MRLFLTALAFAAPAMAQTAANPHAGHNAGSHAQHGAPAADPCTPEHASMGHCTPRQAADPRAGHGAHDEGKMPCCDTDADGKMACCEKMKAKGEDCCAKMGGKPADAHAKHKGHHEGH